MGVLIKEVTTRKLLKKWVEFPNRLYKGNEYFVPFLFNDEMDTFTKEKNPAYEFCETKLFLAYKDDEVVGRIGAIINHAYNKKWDKNAVRFTRFDFIDDYEVSQALFDAVCNYAKENGLTSIMGPIGFTDLDHEGMLVEGYNELNMTITFYNYPYYLEHMTKLGLVKDIDWVEFQVFVPKETDKRIDRISQKILDKYGFSLVTYTDRKVLYKEAFDAFKVIDAAFSKLYGTVPLTPAIINKTINDYIPLVNMDYICSIKNKEGEIIGFGILVPSMAKAFKKSKGKLFPFGIFRMLKALKGKNDVLEMFLVGVDPQYQNTGIPAIMLNSLLKKCIENKVIYCETGPELETNIDVQGMWKGFETRQHKRRRCFIKDV